MLETLAFIAIVSAPILAWLLVGALACTAAWVVARRIQTPERKWKATVLAVLAVYAIPTWDEIVGRSYYNYLCATEGGTKIHRQVKLPPEYWNADGTPVFLSAQGYKIHSKLDDYYRFEIKSTEHFSKLFRIQKVVYPATVRNTGELIGTYTLFHYFGGWFQNATSMNVKGINCPNERGFYPRFLRALFIPEIIQ